MTQNCEWVFVELREVKKIFAHLLSNIKVMLIDLL